MKRGSIIFMVIIFLFVLGFNYSFAQSETDLDAAKKLYNQGDYEGAVKLLKDFIVNAAMEETQKQNVAEAYYLLAKIYHVAGDDAQTEANLKKVFKVLPSFAKEESDLAFKEKVLKIKGAMGIRDAVPPPPPAKKQVTKPVTQPVVQQQQRVQQNQITPYIPPKKKQGGFFIKLKGGASLIEGGDFRTMIDGQTAYFDEFDINNDRYTISHKDPPVFMGGAAEIGIDLGMIAIGVEAGILTNTYQIDYAYSGSYDHTYIWDHTLSAIPILLNLYVKLVDTASLNLSINAGGGMYMGKYKENTDHDWIGNSYYEYATDILDTKQNAFGFHGGIVIDLKLSGNFIIFIEAKYRLVSFNKMTGTETYEDNQSSDDWVGDLHLAESKTSDMVYLMVNDSISSAYTHAAAELNLNGIAIAFGIQIILGSM